MSTRVRLALLLTAVVVATLGLVFLVVRGAVFAPFAKEALSAYLDQVVYVTEELERGADRQALEQRLGLDIKVVDHPPGFGGRGGGRFGEGRGRRCSEEQHRGHSVVICRGPRAPVAVAFGDHWVVVRRDLDMAAPEARIGPALLLIAVAVIAAAIWLAAIVTRPLQASIAAMERFRRGELSHRLPTHGPKELAEVAHTFNGMADRVDAILRAERELMAGISHELRTPLARLRLELELLRDEGHAPEKRLGAMEADLQEVDKLIGELLELSRLSIGERRLEKAQVTLSEVVADATARHPLPQHRLEVSGQGAEVEGDRAQLTRLLSNLLQNAEKYAPAGSPVEITLAGKTLEVRDRGPGVPPDDLPHLFEPFYRGARAKSGSATGLGLGLMIARQVAVLHGGTLTAENRPGGGLCLRLVLP